MTYDFPICPVCKKIIPRGWDNHRNKPEVPSRHKARVTCSPKCQSKHMSEKMMGVKHALKPQRATQQRVMNTWQLV